MGESEPSPAQVDRLKLQVWLEEGMEWKGWKTPQLAKRSKVSRGTISGLLNPDEEKTAQVKPGTLVKLARALERPLPDVGETPTDYVVSPEMRVWETLHILEDAVARARAVLDSTPAGEAPGEVSGPLPDLYERHEDVASKDAEGENDIQDPPT